MRLPKPGEGPNDGRTRAPEPQLDRRAFLETGALALSGVALWACERDLPLAPRGKGPDGEEPRFLFASGIENSYPLLPNGRRIDEMEKCDHYRRWRDDFGLAQELGLDALRYGPAYYRTNPAPGRYDWSSVDDQMAWLRSSGTTVIADLCHFGMAALAQDYHYRYGIPLFVSETNRIDVLAVDWLEEQWRETSLTSRVPCARWGMPTPRSSRAPTHEPGLVLRKRTPPQRYAAAWIPYSSAY